MTISDKKWLVFKSKYSRLLTIKVVVENRSPITEKESQNEANFQSLIMFSWFFFLKITFLIPKQ